MCNFLSAVFLKNGDMLCDPEHTDSHSVLIAAAGLKDDESSYYHANIAKCELTPPDDAKAWGELNKWDFRVDEREVPAWLDQDKARDMMERRIAQMFIEKSAGVVLGGCWIFNGKKAKIKQLTKGRVVAVINGANLQGANLQGANLQGANLKGANLYGANLQGANLEGAILEGANLEGAILEGANLQGANLQGANLGGANLQGADLKGAYLKGANNVPLPDGWVINKDGFATRI